MNYKVLSIGQCSFDNSGLSKFCSKVDAEYVACSSSEQALKLIKQNDYSLIFVNRIFDANGESGISFIKELKNKHPNQKVLLISNYPDKQEIAVQSGALKGFGKNDINSQTSLELVKSYLTS